MSHRLMTKFLALALCFASVVTLRSQNDYSIAMPTEGDRSIVVFFENDVHCELKGYAKMAGLRDAVRDTAYAAVVSSGDFLQGGVVGAISKGQYIIDIMKSVRYDAVTIGNHEFDYLTPRMLQLLADLNAPVTCCNLYDILGNLVYRPYTISTYGNKRVAFIGVLTPDTQYLSESYAFYSSSGAQLYDTRCDTYVQLVQQAVNDARHDGADYVILLSHLGERQEPQDRYTSTDLIAATSGIDVVLDGHTHSVINTTVNNSQGKPVLLCQTGTQFANIGKLVISRDGNMAATIIPTDQVNHVSDAVAAEVTAVDDKVNEEASRVVFHSDVPLLVNDENGNRMVRNAETNAADIVADAMRYFMQADIGVINGGAVRVDLPAGDIRYRDVINLLPFDNNVCKIEALGSTILQALQLGVKNLPGESGEFVQVSGMKYTASSATRTVSDVLVLQADGTYAPIDPDRHYTVALSDYCVTEGGLNGVFKGCKMLVVSHVLYRDYFTDYVQKVLGGNIGNDYATPQGRITIVE